MQAGVGENLGRGLVAVRCAEGVYLSWRLLSGDPIDLAFNVYRQEGDSPAQRINAEPVTRTTDCLDRSAQPGQSYRYLLRSFQTGAEKEEAAFTVTVPEEAGGLPFLRIPLDGNYAAQKVALGDLDGDGELEFVIKQPNFNTDPYQHPGYWKKSEDTYKIEAYKLDGRLLWRYDMGWAIEEGIWYSPYVVYDLDGDGCAEVYAKAGEGDPRDPDGRVTSGPEYLVRLDGKTGQVAERIPWLPREGYPDYNYYCRNFLAVAYVDGVHPSLIMQRGTYNLIRIQALDTELNPIWTFDTDSSPDHRAYRGQGAHGLATADVDGDGKDELVIGSAVIDHDGKPLWTTRLGHPDIMYVAHFIPDRPGLQVFYGIEPCHEGNSVCLVDARTGEILWGINTPTKHVHGQGMVGDIDPDHPGIECYAREQDGSQTWLHSATGELLSTENMGGTSPKAVWWDADCQKELVYGRKLRKYKGPDLGDVPGRVIAVVDCLGDWREEIIASLDGELRIYTTAVPASSRNRCLLTDRQYRLGVVAQSMGCYYPPQLGLDYGKIR